MKNPIKRIKPKYYRSTEWNQDTIARFDIPTDFAKWFNFRNGTWEYALPGLTKWKLKELKENFLEMFEIKPDKVLIRTGRWWGSNRTIELTN